MKSVIKRVAAQARNTRCRFVVSVIPGGASVAIQHAADLGGPRHLGTMGSVEAALALVRESHVNRGLPEPTFTPGPDEKLDAVAPWIECVDGTWRLA